MIFLQCGGMINIKDGAMMEWLDNLKNMKAKSNLTTREISEKSNIPEPTLEKLFAGQTKDPKLSTIQSVVHSLGYTLDDLDSSDIKNTPESDEPDTEEELLARAKIIYDFCRQMGYLEEDGDISDETLRMFMSLADFLDSWFSREDM